MILLMTLLMTLTIFSFWISQDFANVLFCTHIFHNIGNIINDIINDIIEQLCHKPDGLLVLSEIPRCFR